MKTAYPKIREGCKDEETDSKLACKAVSKDLYQRDTSEMKRSEIEPESLADRADGKDIKKSKQRIQFHWRQCKRMTCKYRTLAGKQECVNQHTKVK